MAAIDMQQPIIADKKILDHVDTIEKPELDLEQNQDTSPSMPSITTTPKDPDIVDWEFGADDPARAVNWSTAKKWRTMGAIAAVTFLSPLTSSLVAPGIPKIMAGLHFTDTTLGSFIVSIYLLGYVLGPLIMGPMSEIYGRLPLYHINNLMFVVWNTACAVSPNVGSLLFFRLMAGIAGSNPLTIGGGSIADMFIVEQRGAAMALMGIGPLLGPVLGPLAGGYLAQNESWRWMFWILTIASGGAAVISFALMSETYEPVLLQRRVAVLKKESGKQDLKSKLAPQITRSELLKRAIVRPTKMLFLSPIVFILSLCMAVVYGYLYLLFTTLDLVFAYEYGFNEGSVGLTFLGIGLGSLLGLFILGAISDRMLKRLKARNNGVTKPEFRLPILIPGSFMLPIGMFWYGWSAQNHLHWIMPILGTAWVGLGMLFIFMPIQMYLIDAYTTYAASAVAAATVFRSLVGAFLPLAGPKLFQSLGLGWGSSLLGFLACSFIPISLLLYKYGERIRKSKYDRFAATDR